MNINAAMKNIFQYILLISLILILNYIAFISNSKENKKRKMYDDRSYIFSCGQFNHILKILTILYILSIISMDF